VKILHMHFGKEGGAERFFVNLAHAFGERGAEQRFAIRPGRLWHDDIAALGSVYTNHYRRLSLSSPIFSRRVHRIIKTWTPDAVMAWMSRSSRLIPDTPGAVKLTRLGDYPRHLRHFQHNDLIVANTPGIAEHCQKLGFARPIHVVSNFARQVDVRPVPRALYDTPQDAFVIAGSGRFVRRKGFADLIVAAAKIPGIWLWLIGTGDEEPAMRAQVAELGLAPRTRFFGWVDEPMHVIAAADCFVMPSRHEPLGNVILEVWHTGVPVVSTASEGPSWFARDSEDALLVPIQDSDAIAAAISQIRDNPNLAQNLVAAGRASLTKRFTKERIVDQYFEIFSGRY